MTSVSKTYTIGKLKQLIDLNEDSVNFKTEFKVTSASPFDMAVVDQTALDSNEFEYKHVTTEEISGNVKNDKNIYQNYFMILKADAPTEVQVYLEKQEIEPAQETSENVPASNSLVSEVSEESEESSNDKTAMYIIVAIVICACLIGGYYYLNSGSKKKEKAITFQAPMFTNDSNPFEKSSSMNSSSSSIDFRSPEKSSSFFNSSSANSSNGSSSSAGSFLNKIRARNND
jgi:hypothetical protein